MPEKLSRGKTIPKAVSKIAKPKLPQSPQLRKLSPLRAALFGAIAAFGTADAAKAHTPQPEAHEEVDQKEWARIRGNAIWRYQAGNRRALAGEHNKTMRMMLEDDKRTMESAGKQFEFDLQMFDPEVRDFDERAKLFLSQIAGFPTPDQPDPESEKDFTDRTEQVQRAISALEKISDLNSFLKIVTVDDVPPQVHLWPESERPLAMAKKRADPVVILSSAQLLSKFRYLDEHLKLFLLQSKEVQQKAFREVVKKQDQQFETFKQLYAGSEEQNPTEAI